MIEIELRENGTVIAVATVLANEPGDHVADLLAPGEDQGVTLSPYQVFIRHRFPDMTVNRPRPPDVPTSLTLERIARLRAAAERRNPEP